MSSHLKALRPESDLMTATRRVVRAGFTAGELTDASGAVVANASSTLLVFDV